MKKLVVLASMIIAMFSLVLLGGCGSQQTSAVETTQKEATVAKVATQAAEAAVAEETTSAEKTAEAPEAKTEAKKKAASQEITADKAMEIALKDAGVTNDEATRKDIDLEFDDDYGKEVFDVEFHKGTTEYTFDIDPANGKILKSENEIDD